MKENEYDNGYTERQTVGSNPPELPQIRVSVFENYFAQKPLGDVDLIKSVSYTHLTLPTICSV